MPDKTLLEELREKRSGLEDALIEAADARAEQRDAYAALTEPTDEQRGEYRSAEAAYLEAHEARKAEIATLSERIDTEELKERRRQDAAAANRGRVDVRSEPLTYRRDNAQKISYFRDLASTRPEFASHIDDPAAAHERLQRHAAEMNVELPKRDAERERRAQEQIDRAERAATGGRGLADSPFERRVNPNRTDGQGGYFVPPLWLVDEFIPLLRAGRVASGMARQMDLPSGTDSINIPKVNSGTSVAMQTADNAAVSSTDLTDTSISAGVMTASGQQDVALQLLEQSPGQIFDQVVTQDLIADYNQKVDKQVVLGTGSNGQVKGILPVGNWSGSTVTYTQAGTILPQNMMDVNGALASVIATKRFSVENVHLLYHPRRWFWLSSGVDSQGRSLAVSNGLGPVNVNALVSAGLSAEGLVGQIPQLPNAGIYISANVPATATAAGAVTSGTNDLVVAAKWDDLWLFEGALRTRVLSEVLSGTLQVRFQVYNYLAFLVRYGESIAVAQGTGLAAPASAQTGLSSVTF